MCFTLNVLHGNHFDIIFITTPERYHPFEKKNKIHKFYINYMHYISRNVKVNYSQKHCKGAWN